MLAGSAARGLLTPTHSEEAAGEGFIPPAAFKTLVAAASSSRCRSVIRPRTVAET